MAGASWAGEGAGVLCWPVLAEGVSGHFGKGQMLKQVLLVLDLGGCCLHPLLGGVEGGWDLVSLPSATLGCALIQQFLDQ